ncbi:MAG: class I SAM-dependent methyltransferase, partial [Rhizobiales bacterium]|nr:class I SAM-dependent methyltransferase [Hyphomicrobiales bacterium]
MIFDGKTRALGGTSRPRESLVARVVRRMIAQIEFGHITVVLPTSDRIEHSGNRAGPSAALVLHRWRAIRRLVSEGDLGFAEAYIDGDWSSPDLALLLELAAQNIAVLDSRISGFLPVRMLNRVRHFLRANSKSGSRRNISFHYDLGNEFYQHWLDPSMT